MFIVRNSQSLYKGTRMPGLRVMMTLLVLFLAHLIECITLHDYRSDIAINISKCSSHVDSNRIRYFWSTGSSS